MFWVNQIVGFFYQLYLQNKSVKSIRLSCRLSGCFLGIRSLGFLNFGLVVETLIKLFLTARFSGKLFCLKNWGNGPKRGFFKFNPTLGGLFRGCSFWGEGGGGLEFVRIMLETWNLVRKYTPICSFRKYNFYHQGPLKFADVSKNSSFTGQNVLRQSH